MTINAQLVRVTSKTFIIAAGIVAISAAAVANIDAQAAKPAAGPQPPTPSITFATKPTPPATGASTFTVVVKDADGQPVTGADVTVEFVMPAMPAMQMPEMRNTTTLKAPSDAKVAATGTYVATGQIMMAGTWNVTVKAKKGGKDFVEKKLTVTAK